MNTKITYSYSEEEDKKANPSSNHDGVKKLVCIGFLYFFKSNSVLHNPGSETQGLSNCDITKYTLIFCK